MSLFDRQVRRYADAIMILRTGTPAEQERAAARQEQITRILEQSGIEFTPFLAAVDRRVAELENAL
jgi:hypothetical protein